MNLEFAEGTEFNYNLHMPEQSGARPLPPEAVRPPVHYGIRPDAITRPVLRDVTDLYYETMWPSRFRVPKRQRSYPALERVIDPDTGKVIAIDGFRLGGGGGADGKLKFAPTHDANGQRVVRIFSYANVYGGDDYNGLHERGREMERDFQERVDTYLQEKGLGIELPE